MIATNMASQVRPIVTKSAGWKKLYPAPLGAFTAQEILQGLENDEFEPFFQPRINVRTMRVVGAEALARWRHPKLGIVGPQAFVEILDDAGKIDRLSRCMLAKAARFGRTLNREGCSGTMAVNLSITSLANASLAEELTAEVTSQQVDPRHVVLDISAGPATTDCGKAIDNLTRLHTQGFALSIDASGEGYASMQRLASLPFSELKIDRSLIAYAGRCGATKPLLSSSIQLARQLGIQSVAEKIETQAHWNLLVDLRCDIAQGYYIAQPMSDRCYLKWLSRRRSFIAARAA